MSLQDQDNLESVYKAFALKPIGIKFVSGFLLAALCIGCNIPPPDVGVTGTVELREQEQEAMEFALGAVENVLGGDAESFMDAHAEQIHVVGDEEIFPKSAVMASVDVIANTSNEISVGWLQEYFKKYEPRLIHWAKYQKKDDIAVAEGWTPPENAYVFIGNNLQDGEGFPRDHLFNFILGESNEGWEIIGLLPE